MRNVLFTIALCVLTMAAAPNRLSDKHTATVSIKGMKFDPDTVKIAVGDTVQWTNDDDRDHTVTSKDGSFKSDKLGHGDTFEFKFKKAGKYAYGCSYHPRMKGVVIVE